LASLITALLLSDILLFRFRWEWDKDFLSPILKYAYPLLFTGLAGTVNSMIDKILLEKLLPKNFYSHVNSLGAVGIYGAAIKMGVLMTLAVQAFKYAAEPFFFGQAQDKQAPALFAKVMVLFVAVTAGMWVLVSVNVELIAYFFLQNKAYHQALPLVPVILLANLLLGIYFNLTVWFKLTDKTYFGTWIAMIGAVLTILGNFIFIPFLGYWACVLVTFFVYLVMIFLSEYWSKKYFPIAYDWKKIVLILVFGGLIISVYYVYIIHFSYILRFFLGNILAISYVFGLYKLKYK
jgi:O-antigen/teichoic acid export membrane protein